MIQVSHNEKPAREDFYRSPRTFSWRLTALLLSAICLFVSTGCQDITQRAQTPVQNESTNSIETETWGFAYGPSPVVPSEASGEYFQRFEDALRWQFGVVSFNKNFKPTDVGEIRMQFHLNSNGSIGDLIMLTNATDREMENICKAALLGKTYESWPQELRQRQFAGYFTVRFMILSDYATNFPPDLNSTLGIGRMTGTYPTNVLANVTAHFEADPAYLIVGMIQMHTNNYLNAASNFTKEIEWDPGDAWAYGALGYCFAELTNYDAAMANLSKALALDPQNASTWANLALVETRLKDYSEVVTDATWAVTLNPDFTRAYHYRAYARKRLQDFSGALEDSEQCVRLEPTNAAVWFTRGQVRYCLGDYGHALSDCNSAISLNAHYAAAYVLRGDIQQAQHSSTAALASFQEALEINPNLDYARFKAWILRCEAEDTNSATRELKQHFSLRPQSTEWSYQVEAFLTGSLSEEDFLGAANASAKTPQERTEQLCEANYYAGVKRLLAGDKKSAAAFFQKAVATGVRDFGEYIRAQDELKALQNVTSASM